MRCKYDGCQSDCPVEKRLCTMCVSDRVLCGQRFQCKALDSRWHIPTGKAHVHCLKEESIGKIKAHTARLLGKKGMPADEFYKAMGIKDKAYLESIVKSIGVMEINGRLIAPESLEYGFFKTIQKGIGEWIGTAITAIKVLKKKRIR